MKKIVLVTGGSGNLGRATVERYSSEGYQVIATVTPGKGLGYELSGVITYEADLTNENSVSELITRIITNHKTIDIAILTVGGYAPGSIEGTDGVTLQKMIALNFNTAYFVARPVFHQMLSQSSGRIIFIGARPGLVPAEGKNSIAYALSKSLIFQFAELLNAEAKGKNIVSSVIVPGTIDTPANREAMPTADASKWVTADEITKAMFFLTSDDAHPLRSPVLKLYSNS